MRAGAIDSHAHHPPGVGHLWAAVAIYERLAPPPRGGPCLPPSRPTTVHSALIAGANRSGAKRVQGGGGEQLLDAHRPGGDALLVGIADERLERVAIGLQSVRPVVFAHQVLYPLQ